MRVVLAGSPPRVSKEQREIHLLRNANKAPRERSSLVSYQIIFDDVDVRDYDGASTLCDFADVVPVGLVLPNGIPEKLRDVAFARVLLQVPRLPLATRATPSLRHNVNYECCIIFEIPIAHIFPMNFRRSFRLPTLDVIYEC